MRVKEGTFLRRMHPVLTPKLYFRISMIFYTALSTNRCMGKSRDCEEWWLLISVACSGAKIMKDRWRGEGLGVKRRELALFTEQIIA